MLQFQDEEVSDEIESLKAIYGEDFEDRPLGIWDSINFVIRVRSLASEQIYCIVYINFNLSKTYPKTPPSITFEDCKGISDSDKEKLLKYLKGFATRNRGKVMIYELVMQAQNFVVAKNKKPQTLNEEMEIRKEKEKEVMESLFKEDSSDNINDKFNHKRRHNHKDTKLILNNILNRDNTDLISSNLNLYNIEKDTNIKSLLKIKNQPSNHNNSSNIVTNDSEIGLNDNDDIDSYSSNIYIY